MWLNYLHNDDPCSDDRHGRAKAKAVADFARLQPTVIREARKRGESAAPQQSAPQRDSYAR